MSSLGLHFEDCKSNLLFFCVKRKNGLFETDYQHQLGTTDTTVRCCIVATTTLREKVVRPWCMTLIYPSHTCGGMHLHLPSCISAKNGMAGNMAGDDITGHEPGGQGV